MCRCHLEMEIRDVAACLEGYQAAAVSRGVIPAMRLHLDMGRTVLNIAAPIVYLLLGMIMPMIRKREDEKGA